MEMDLAREAVYDTYRLMISTLCQISDGVIRWDQ